VLGLSREETFESFTKVADYFTRGSVSVKLFKKGVLRVLVCVPPTLMRKPYTRQ
jgi:hypothetical protein